MVAQQRRNLSRKMPFYICIDVDLKQIFDVIQATSYRLYMVQKGNKPLVLGLKIDGSYMFGGQRWNDYRKQGFERA